ncbi:putative caspase-16 isoform X2 [Tupaia chinensis]|uniref:putative caspase-16 isoform X2 n=1 Tax=Tupaia chinensis TaxID=246437 RepID=UPI0003C8E41A|nr:putative caspase-16 isoform X2 [Tupaia chinensis]
MAHGGPQGQLLGADGHQVQPEALVQELSRCRVLRGRPKIFLLQACRGGNRDAGVGPPALPWYWRWLRTPPAIPSHADVLQIHANAQGGFCRDPTPGTSDQADILMVYAAAEGCVAYRDEKGSDFIQTLVEVLSADPGGDLLELLTEVNRRVCALDVLGPSGDELQKACLEIRSSLRCRLCLQAGSAGPPNPATVTAATPGPPGLHTRVLAPSGLE